MNGALLIFPRLAVCCPRVEVAAAVRCTQSLNRTARTRPVILVATLVAG